MDITEDVVKLVAWKFLEGAGPSGMDLYVLQGWILKVFGDIKKVCISVESFVDWLANQGPPWAAYRVFMSGNLVELDKQPVLHQVGVRKSGIDFSISV